MNAVVKYILRSFHLFNVLILPNKINLSLNLYTCVKRFLSYLSVVQKDGFVLLYLKEKKLKSFLELRKRTLHLQSQKGVP